MSKPSRYTLVEWLLGKVDGAAAEEIARYVEHDADAREFVAQFRADSAEYADRMDEHEEALLAALDQIEQSQQSPESGSMAPPFSRRSAARQKLYWIAPAAALAAAAALILVLVYPQAEDPQAPEAPAVQFRGKLTFDVIAKRHDDQFLVADGATLTEGDALRFIIYTQAAGFVSVFSLDAHGNSFPYYPDTPETEDPRPLELSRGGRHELPESVILDDSQGVEHFVVLYSKSPFNRHSLHQRVTNLIQHGGDLSVLGDSVDIGVLRVEKSPRVVP